MIFIPNSFIKFYNPERLETAINSWYKDIAELDGTELTVQSQKMKEFVQPSIDRICSIIFESLERVKGMIRKLEDIYLVGGFG